MGNCNCCYHLPCCRWCCPRKRRQRSSSAAGGEEEGLLRQQQEFVDDNESWLDEIWHDALQEHDEFEATFDVSSEELFELKKQLSDKFPTEIPLPLSDAYILSVASKPYSKDMSVRRPLEYSLEKLTQVMEWRRSYNASELLQLVELAAKKQKNGDDDDEIMAMLSDDKQLQVEQMAKSLNTASWYWHGLTKHGHPILWIRTNRKPWYPNVDAEIRALIVMSDIGILRMMPDITDFYVISHSYKPPPPNPKFAYKMLHGLSKGYPDRLHCLISAPVSSIVEFCMNLLMPLMPGRLANKFIFMSLDHVREKLPDLLLNGYDDIPSFYGGPNTDHDKYYPDEQEAAARQQDSSLLMTFDWDGMVKRMKEQNLLYVERQKQEEQQIQQQLQEHQIV